MSTPGRNLPDFRDSQLAFAAHIRDPAGVPVPADVAPERMQVYVELFYNTVEGCLRNIFPVLHRTLPAAHWHGLARDFLHRHGCQSPFYLDIAQEFMAFLQQGRGEHPAAAQDPPWLLELAHYEWLELALDIAPESVPENIDPDGDLLAGCPAVSPLARPVAYAWPVHRIGPRWQPQEQPAMPTHLVVCRDREDRVGFTESNQVTARLLELLSAPERITGAAALAQVAGELGRAGDPAVQEHGLGTMAALRRADIIVGTWLP